MLDWDDIKKQLQALPWEEWEECIVRKVFIGTIEDLHPSGKRYYPWDMQDASMCPTCSCYFSCTPENPCTPHTKDDQPDYHCDACKDSKYVNNLVEAADKYGLFVTADDHDTGYGIWIGEENQEWKQRERNKSIQ